MPVRRDLSEVLSRQQVFEGVRQVVAEQSGLPRESILERHVLVDELGYDSLMMVETMMELEEEFEISVPDDVGERVRTVGDIVDGVVKLLAAEGRSQ